MVTFWPFLNQFGNQSNQVQSRNSGQARPTAETFASVKQRSTTTKWSPTASHAIRWHQSAVLQGETEFPAHCQPWPCLWQQGQERVKLREEWEETAVGRLQAWGGGSGVPQILPPVRRGVKARADWAWHRQDEGTA